MPSRDDTDRAAIHEVYARWFRAMQDGDREGLLTLLADDFVLKGPARPAVSDRAELRRALAEFHQAYTERVSHRVEEVGVAGAWAWARVVEEAVLTPRGGGEPLRLRGTHLGILARQADGRWKVARDVSSLDHPVG